MQQENQIQDNQQQLQNQQEDYKITYSGRKNPLCSICGKINSRYKCPQCHSQTCSLFCSKKHKQFNKCKGVKPPTVYLQKQQIDEANMKKDYKFLVSMMDNVDKVRKSLTGILHLPQQMRFKLLKANAYKLHYIQLKVAPNIIERHRQNISFYFMKTKQIYWVIQMLYYNNQNEPERFVTDPVCDKQQIETIFNNQQDKFVSSEMLTKFGINTNNLRQFHILIRNRYNFRMIRQNGKDKQGQEYRKYEGFNYIEVNRKQSLEKWLRYMTIHEFPTFWLVHNNFYDQFIEKNKVYEKR